MVFLSKYFHHHRVATSTPSHRPVGALVSMPLDGWPGHILINLQNKHDVGFPPSSLRVLVGWRLWRGLKKPPFCLSIDYYTMTAELQLCSAITGQLYGIKWIFNWAAFRNMFICQPGVGRKGTTARTSGRPATCGGYEEVTVRKYIKSSLSMPLVSWVVHLKIAFLLCPAGWLNYQVCKILIR